MLALNRVSTGLLNDEICIGATDFKIANVEIEAYQ